MAKYGLKKLENHSTVRRKAYFYILNRLDVTHRCNRQTDRQTGRLLIANAALHYVAR